jgi:general secretion pathway protein C
MASLLRSYLDRATLFFNLITLSLGAFLMAGIINTFLGHGLRELPSWSSVMPAEPSSGQPAELVKNNHIIVERNYFGSAMAPPPPPVDPPVQPIRVVLSQLRATLIGTIVADDPAWSMSMVIDLTRSETGIYRVGDRLMGEAVVVEVQAQRIYLERDGILQYLVLGEEDSPGSAGDEFSVISAMREPPVPIKGVQRVGANQWRIDRTELEKLTRDFGKIAVGVRIVPKIVEGEMKGFKLYRIRPGSIFSQLGFHNGDVIERINGYPLTSPEIILEIYKKLHKASKIEIEFSRRSAPNKHSYTIF